MSEEQQQLEVAPSLFDRTKVFNLLGKLSISLGCNHPNLDHILEVFKPQRPRADIELLDIQKHFRFLENKAKDPQLQELQQLRAKIFLYLHGMLLKLEPDPQKRRIYLILCYKLFDANKPKIMPLSDMLAYREEYVDRLIKLVQKIIHLNEVELESALCRLRFGCHSGNSTTNLGFVQLEKIVKKRCTEKGLQWTMERREIKFLAVKLRVDGFDYLECKPQSCCCKLKGLRWQQDQFELTKLLTEMPIDLTRLNESTLSINCEYLVADCADGLSVTESDQPTEFSFLNRVYPEGDDNRSVMSALPLRIAAGENPVGETIENLGKWQHERHMIAAPRHILHSFKCNPSYQWSATDQLAPDFFEQFKQFMELMSGKDCPLNAADIKERIKTTMRQAISNHRLSIRLLSSMQLQNLLTEQEQQDYELLRWQHRDRGEFTELSEEERHRDALTGMLGAVCKQLKPSALKSRLLLRSPHHQQSISESFLLLSIGHLGYLYRKMQKLQLRLCQLDECGLVLAYCLQDELLTLHAYHEQQQLQPESLLHLYWQTRSHQLRFQWFDEICKALNSSRTSLLTSLQLQLGLNGQFDELLQLWLLRATQPLLGRICSWLLAGELHKVDFIVEHQEHALGPLHWHSHFELIEELLPPFLNQELAQLLLGVGKSQRYARKLLHVELKTSMQTEQLQQQLSEACSKCYEEQDVEPLKEILLCLQQQTSKALLLQLVNLQPTPMEIIDKLHQYLLLSDADFVRQLIELLEPALEQPVECYNVQLLDNLMRQLLGKHNEQLFVDQLVSGGQKCWCRFLLRWQLPSHWTALIGDRFEQYSSSFAALWQLHHADYVLSERIRRQQAHFLERTGLDQSEDVLQVAEYFVAFIDKLLSFMAALQDYFFVDVLNSALKSLCEMCKITSTLDAFLALHAEYLNLIECGVFQTKDGLKSRLRLTELYDIIFQLETEQQKFLCLCNMVSRSVKKYALKAFHWSCLSTCKVLRNLDVKFQRQLAKFLLSLYSTGNEQFVSLARKLSRDHYYANECEELELVDTFRFMRKFPH